MFCCQHDHSNIYLVKVQVSAHIRTAVYTTRREKKPPLSFLAPLHKYLTMPKVTKNQVSLAMYDSWIQVTWSMKQNLYQKPTITNFWTQSKTWSLRAHWQVQLGARYWEHKDHDFLAILSIWFYAMLTSIVHGHLMTLTVQEEHHFYHWWSTKKVALEKTMLQYSGPGLYAKFLYIKHFQTQVHKETSSGLHRFNLTFLSPLNEFPCFFLYINHQLNPLLSTPREPNAKPRAVNEPYKLQS